MWPWQQKVSRKTIFWGKIILFSSVSHFVALFFVFFVYRGDNFIFKVSVNTSVCSSGADIIYLPLQKTVSPNFNKQGTAITKKPIKSSPKKITPKPVLSKVEGPKIKPKRKTTTLVKPKPKITKVAKAKPQKVKKVVKKDLPKKKKIAKKSVVKKTEKIKVAQKTKTVQPKLREHKEIVSQSDNAAKNPVYLGRHDLEALRLQDAIQGEVEKNWRPPVGLSKDLSCCVKVLVGWDGSIEHVTIDKPSGVLVYDIAARMAVARLQMPQMAKGKEINITFKQ